jgi:hypothetical protein
MKETSIISTISHLHQMQPFRVIFSPYVRAVNCELFTAHWISSALGFPTAIWSNLAMGFPPGLHISAAKQAELVHR